MRKAYHCRASCSIQRKSLGSAVSYYRQYVCPQVIQDTVELSYLIRLAGIVYIRDVKHQSYLFLQRDFIERLLDSLPVVHGESVTRRIVGRSIEYYYKMLLIPRELLHLIIEVGNVDRAPKTPPPHLQPDLGTAHHPVVGRSHHVL